MRSQRRSAAGIQPHCWRSSRVRPCSTSDQLLDQALGAGARGYVLKDGAARNLLDAIDALPRPTLTPPPIAPEAVGHRPGNGVPERNTFATRNGRVMSLTQREREVLRLLAEGESNREVAERLSISAKTVETHRANVMRKLGAGSIVDLVHYAIRNGIVAA
jgi:DNA-binding NarL/FixJ family response regulator